MEDKEKDKKKVTLNLGLVNLEKVDKYCSETGLNRTSVVNLALVKFFEMEEKNK